LTVLHEKGDLSLLLRMTILMGGGALCFGWEKKWQKEWRSWRERRAKRNVTQSTFSPLNVLHLHMLSATHMALERARGGFARQLCRCRSFARFDRNIRMSGWVSHAWVMDLSVIPMMTANDMTFATCCTHICWHLVGFRPQAGWRFDWHSCVVVDVIVRHDHPAVWPWSTQNTMWNRSLVVDLFFLTSQSFRIRWFTGFNVFFELPESILPFFLKYWNSESMVDAQKDKSEE
jgi:hypothetical protein